ncbi:MAG TPA: YheU family protein [Pseudomonadales bacterium]|nr:YheU family protein [Pseudomonadales bacterium]
MLSPSSLSNAFMPIEIPCDRLPPATLQALIEEFATRPGTDYGENEVSLIEKISQIENLLRAKQVVIVFDENTESCDIVSTELWQKSRFC